MRPNRLQSVILCCLSLAVILGPSCGFAQTASPKPRTIVTTDSEVDDQDSFIRLLLYTNEFNLIGLVYSSSQWHYTGDGNGTTFISEMPMTKSSPGTVWSGGESTHTIRN